MACILVDQIARVACPVGHSMRSAKLATWVCNLLSRLSPCCLSPTRHALQQHGQPAGDEGQHAVPASPGGGRLPVHGRCPPGAGRLLLPSYCPVPGRLQARERRKPLRASAGLAISLSDSGFSHLRQASRTGNHAPLCTQRPDRSTHICDNLKHRATPSWTAPASRPPSMAASS